MRFLLDEPVYLYKELVYLCIFSLSHSIILLLLWCDYGQGYGFACIYLAPLKALAHKHMPHL